MTIVSQDVIKLLLAVLIGGIIGAEREFHAKAAGFRTIILICVGATLFTIFSPRLGESGDPARIAANIVSGVGFLGAGVILRDEGRITGLTTASAIWLAAALGMGIGGGDYALSALAAGVLLVVLLIFPRFEGWFHGDRGTRTYQVVCPNNYEKLVQLDAMFRQYHLRVQSHAQIKHGDQITCTWEAFGSARNHAQMMEKLFANTDVKQLRLQY